VARLKPCPTKIRCGGVWRGSGVAEGFRVMRNTRDAGWVGGVGSEDLGGMGGKAQNVTAVTFFWSSSFMWVVSKSC